MNDTSTTSPADEGPETLGDAARVFFSYWGPRLLALQLLVALGIRLTLGPPGLADLLIVLGVAIYWPLQEWFFHLTLLHMRPRKIGPLRIDPYFARTHRDHHRRPWSLVTALLPLRVLFTIAPVHLLFWWLVTPDLAGASAGVAVFTAATLFYEWIHYLTHTPYRPRGAYFRKVRRNHRLHHFRNERYWHSFTMPWLDEWLGTGPEPASVARSSTCHNLGVDDEHDLASEERSALSSRHVGHAGAE